MNLEGDRNFSITEPGFILAVQITAGITSLLSILGASLIIFTYAAFRNLRTTARQLLVSISIADIIVAGSHFVGLFANFERFIHQVDNDNSSFSLNMSLGINDPLCVAQAAFSMFGTLASFLLSLAIGVYLVGIIVWKKPSAWKKILPVIYIICWGIPIILIIPNIAKRYFGYALAADIGWCYIARVNTTHPDHTSYLLAEILSYEIWVYMVFIALPVLYVTAFVYYRCKIRRVKYQPLSPTDPSKSGDLKLLFAPVFFLMLRIWTTILDIVVYGGDDSYQHLMTPTVAALVILAGIGDNGQGIVNAILFCMFTKQVRQQLLTKSSYVNMCKRTQPGSAVDENTTYQNDRQFYNDTTLSYGSSVQTMSRSEYFS